MKISILQPQAIHELGSRPNQEDYIYPCMGRATIEDRLFMVCDGMGGHEKGEVASRLVGETISAYFARSEESVIDDTLLGHAIDEAFDQLNSVSTDDSLRRMGTTLALVCFHRGGCTMAHIGDSRIYHIRPSERRIIYKSRDHSLVYDLLMAREITIDEIRTHPKKNVITHALMPDMEERPTASIAHTADIQAGDCFYLCSDGMLEKMTDDELIEVLFPERSIEEKRIALISATTDNADNHSALLIYVAEVEKEDGDSELLTDENSVKSNAVNLERKILHDDDDDNVSDVWYSFYILKYVLGMTVGILFVLLMLSRC